MSKHRSESPEADPLEEMVGRILETKLGHFLDDIERRLRQTREIEAATAAMASRRDGVPVGRSIHAEDINDRVHRIDGYTVTANSPSGGSIAWTSVHIMYAGVDYTVADGNTANRYVWFVKPGSYTPGTPVTLNTSNTKPTLAAGDTFVFVNNAGTPTSVLDAGGQAGILQPGTVDSAAIINGAVGTTQLGSGAVQSGNIANDAVGSAAIATGAVGSGEIANGAVGSTQIASGGVTPSKLNTLQHVMF